MGIDERFDIVIIGAGPAGCMAAVNLRDDLNVLLIDRLSLPRDKSCAGVLKPSALRLIESYSPPERVYEKPQTIGVTFFDWQAGRQYALPYTYTNTDRNRFDSWLLTLAARRPNITTWQKTQFLSLDATSGEPVLTLRKEGVELTVAARNIVGADGANSRVRKALGRADQAYYFTLQEWIKPKGGHCITDFYGFIDERTYLYDWMVPKGELLVIGGIYTRDENPSERLSHTKRRIKDEFGIEGEVVEGPKGYPIVHLTSMNEVFLGNPNVLLAGEAAGFIDASICEGISYALRSGIACAQAINTAPDNPLRVYTKLTGMEKTLALFDLAKYIAFKPRAFRPLLYTLIPQIRTVKRLG